MVRMWSIHPRFLDKKGLGGQWREAIQCRAILEENRLSGGHIAHPQLDRFRLPFHLLQPHENYHFNYFLHTIYSEGRHIRGYNYNLNFIGRHNPIGCSECNKTNTLFYNPTSTRYNASNQITPMTSTTTTTTTTTTKAKEEPIDINTLLDPLENHATLPLNPQHIPTTYHLDKPYYYTPERYRVSLPYQDTIIRDNINAGFTNYEVFREALYPLLIQTPRNLVEYSKELQSHRPTKKIADIIDEQTTKILRFEKFEEEPLFLYNHPSHHPSQASPSVPSSSTSRTAKDNSTTTTTTTTASSSQLSKRKASVLEDSSPSTSTTTKKTRRSRSSPSTSTTVSSSTKQKAEVILKDDEQLISLSNLGSLQPIYGIEHRTSHTLTKNTKGAVKGNAKLNNKKRVETNPINPTTRGLIHNTTATTTDTTTPPDIAMYRFTLPHQAKVIWQLPRSYSHQYIQKNYNKVLDLYFPLPSPTSRTKVATKNVSKSSSPLSQSTSHDLLISTRNDIIQQFNQMPISYKAIPVTLGQVLYEWKHLLTRLSMPGRDPSQAELLKSVYIDINYQTSNNNTMYKPSVIQFCSDNDNDDDGDNNGDDENDDDQDGSHNTKKKNTKATTSTPSSSSSLRNALLDNDDIDDANDDDILIEKHPYVTGFSDYGLPDWLNIHASNHNDAHSVFNNVPSALKLKKNLDTTIPGYDPDSVVELNHRQRLESERVETSLVEKKGKGGKRSSKSTTPSLDSNNDGVNSDDDDDDNEDEGMKKRSTKRVSSSSSSSSSTSTSTCKPLSSIFQIKPVKQLPKGCSHVLHINDLLNPLFYIVDGEIEYTEVLGDHDLGELLLFNGI